MNLTELANKYGTDKGDKNHEAHGYAKIYEKLFKDLKDKEGCMLEIGVNDPRFPGASLKMWREFFTNKDFKIFGYDITNTDHLAIPGDNVFTIQGDQSDKKDLVEKLTFTMWDVIIDDGSHFHTHQMMSYNTLFKFVKPGGYYIIEDLHSHDGWKTCQIFKSIIADPIIESIVFYDSEKLLVLKRR